MNHTPEKWRPLDEPLSSFSKAPGLGSQDKCKWSAFISTCSYCKKDWIHNQIFINTYIDIYIGINLIVFNEICIVYYLFFNLLIPICPITPSPFRFLSAPHFIVVFRNYAREGKWEPLISICLWFRNKSKAPFLKSPFLRFMVLETCCYINFL